MLSRCIKPSLAIIFLHGTHKTNPSKDCYELGWIYVLTRERYEKAIRRQEIFMDKQTQIELEAAAFRQLQTHLMQKRTDVQNIDLMNLAGFCRNCLSRWYQEAAQERGIDLSKDAARESFYGMSMAQWKAQYQTEASPTQKQSFDTAFAENVSPVQKS